MLLKVDLRKSFHILLLLHFIANGIHMAAHIYHGVPAVFLVSLPGKALGWLFIALFFVILPLLGWWQFWKNQAPRCYYTLAIAMFPAWAYAFMYHFVLDTSDYVCLFGSSVAGRWFSWSAYSTAVIDGGLFVLSIYALVQFWRKAWN